MKETTSETDRPWDRHYKANHIEVILETPTLRILEARFADGDDVPLHTHSHVIDHFWVIEGRLDIETVCPDQRIQLGAGGYFAITPGCAHRVRNSSGKECHFVNLQGFGAYDFTLRQNAR